MITRQNLDEWLAAAEAQAMVSGSSWEIAPNKFHDCSRDCRFIVKSSPTGIFMHGAPARIVELIGEILWLRGERDRLMEERVAPLVAP